MASRTVSARITRTRVAAAAAWPGRTETLPTVGIGRVSAVRGTGRRSAADAGVLAGRGVRAGAQRARRDEAVLDHRVGDVVARDRDRVEQEGGHLSGLVVDAVRSVGVS